jgi:hypothetical protein
VEGIESMSKGETSATRPPAGGSDTEGPRPPETRAQELVEAVHGVAIPTLPLWRTATREWRAGSRRRAPPRALLDAPRLALDARRLAALMSIGVVRRRRCAAILLPHPPRGRAAEPADLYVRKGTRGPTSRLDPNPIARTGPRPSTGGTHRATASSWPTASPRPATKKACCAFATWRRRSIVRT